MKRCPACGTEYAPGDLICEKCEAQLPEPYENDPADQNAEKYGDRLCTSPTQSKSNNGENYITCPRISPAVTFPDGSVILSGADVYLEETIISPGTVVIVEGRIAQLLEGSFPQPPNCAAYFDLTGLILAPGFIDIHIHGMMDVETNTATAHEFRQLSWHAVKHGITALLPTTVACSALELRQVLSNLREARQAGLPGARLLGLHLESNFISPQFKGAQPPEAIFTPDDPQAAEIKDILEEWKEDVCMVTLAPELPGALELIQWLRQYDIVVSLGHSAANYDQSIAGIAAGATQATHLFNAMAPLHHRNPNLIGAALERDEVYTQIVCDGVHVHPAVISTVISAKGPERTVPISDGLRGAGMKEGEFMFGDRLVKVIGGVAKLPDGTIAGSITTMDAIVRFLVNDIGWDLGESLLMAAATPADSLGYRNLGRIAPDAAADLVVLDEKLNVIMTLVGGRVAYPIEESMEDN